MDDLAPGIRRITLPLPPGPGYVRVYVLRASAGFLLADGAVT